MPMVHLAEYPVEEIVPLLGKRRNQPFTKGHRGEREFALPNGQTCYARIGTLRLLCLKENQSCVWCGRTGNVFVLEHDGQSHNPRAHLNLYHTSPHSHPKYLLMTQDHIVPLSRGGPNTLENSQTMCTHCNQAKGTLTQLHFVLKMTGWGGKAKYVARAPDGVIVACSSSARDFEEQLARFAPELIDTLDIKRNASAQWSPTPPKNG